MSGTGLTSFSRFGGCGAKLGPGTLERALCELAQPDYPELLAGFAGSEDAGIWRLDAERALVQTVDFFPPVVDDPFMFGRIAAANALSDIWAMGGKPLTALALVSWPVEGTGIEALRAAMAGGLDALVEAGCALAGGHSINDAEPKLGYAITGMVHPDRFWRNSTIRPGCALILTKPIGTGLVTTAARGGLASATELESACASMARLNGAAAALLARYSPAACTDITGFGLAGHACEMAAGASAGIRLDFRKVPLLPGAARFSDMGLVPEGTMRNREGRAAFVDGLGKLRPEDIDILFDPQTSGGLLAAIPLASAMDAVSALCDAGIEAAIIGGTTEAAGRVAINA